MDHHHHKEEKLRSYMEDLEEERRKIQVFRRELPLCLVLVSQAIDTCKKQLLEVEMDRKYDTYLDLEQQITTSMELCRPRVLEEMEFIPIIRCSSSSPHVIDEVNTDDDHEHQYSRCEIDKDDKKMSDWLRSASLWNTSPDNMSIQLDKLQESDQVSLPEEEKRNSDASPPLERGKTAGRIINLSPERAVESASPPESAHTTSSMADAGARRRSAGSAGAHSKLSAEEEEERSKRNKKQRRNWSPELHRSFVHALQQLGGSYATPKQIRELMKVNGLTNDEIKSHLQKYRIYNTRKQINPAAAPRRGNYIQQQPQTTQLVFVGGIWIPPPPLTTTPLVSATSSAAEPTFISNVNMVGINTSIIYTPVAVHNKLNTHDSIDIRDGPKSATASSSTHTVTVC